MKEKRFLLLLLAVALATGLLFAAMELLGGRQEPDNAPAKDARQETAVRIDLSDSGVSVDGQAASTDTSAAVYTANDIIYYEEGHDFTYGEGTEADAHSAEEAAAHTVVHITRPGTYRLSGKLSAGQVAVDLGEEAEDDPSAVVTLILDGVDITCTVAPAVIFYNVYECGDKDAPSKDVDTSAAGANVIIADGATNHVSGSYVERIYKPDTVELSEDGTEVKNAKKLHKYDAAFYSKMSMNVNGGEVGSGILHIDAENEGLDSELHLTMNGGTVNISSGNDGINTNEDGVSVTTINGGNLTINVTGETGEGDGIDSNGWLVINGGTVIAAACSSSADAGIDADMGIHIHGGTVIATGHMLDRIEAGGQNYAVFTFSQSQSGDSIVTLRNSAGEELMALWPVNDYSVLIYSSPGLTAGDHTLYSGNTLLAHSGTGSGGFGGMMPRPDGEWPEDMEPPKLPEGMEPPAGMDRPGGREDVPINEDGTVTLPDGATLDPSQLERPEGGPGGMGSRPGGMGSRPGGMGSRPGGQMGPPAGEPSTVFTITDGASMFSGIAPAE